MSKTFLKTCFSLFMAVNLTGIGVVLFIQADLGSDTITVLEDGLHRLLGITLGSASRIYNLIFISIAFLVARKHIGWTTVVFALTVGIAIDLYGEILIPLHIEQQDLLWKLLWILAAQLCYGIAFALLIVCGSGMNQVDAISYYVCDKLHVKYVYVRTSMDILQLLLGWIMGGVVGIGSLIAMTTTGMFVDGILKIFHYDKKCSEVLIQTD